ncbi:MAG TPA: hypothetical protein ENK65_02035 [Helicobacteraceae bacterium]|nr:hypothetical protein [Helicobacteraceae bacterium]
MKFLTQYINEKIWHEVSEEEVIKLLEATFSDGDAIGTLTYIKSACQNGKVITVGDSRYKIKS